MVKSVLAASLLGLAAASKNTVTEYVALQPASGQSGAMDSTLNWVKVEYPENVTSVSDVVFTDAAGSEELGAWDQMNLGAPLKITGRNFGDKFYGYVNTGRAPDEGPCCADIIRIWDKSDGSHTDVDIMTPMEEVFEESDYDYATHTFTLDEYNGEVVAFCMSQFQTAELGGAPVDVVVAISMETGKIVQTKAGDDYFSFWEKLGTTSTDTAESIFKVQHYVEKTATNATKESLAARRQLQGPPGPSESAEQWHGNGMARWTMADGTKIMAITHKSLDEAILMSDPWESATGGKILQRFGNPSANGVSHRFGIDSEQSAFTGMHNIFYAKAPDGRESATVFVNGFSGSPYSWVFEFDINLVDEASVSKYTDSVFDTTYRKNVLPFQTDTQGGARPIGMTSGSAVWIVAAGNAMKGLYAIDETSSKSQHFESSISYYDPFAYIVA